MKTKSTFFSLYNRSFLALIAISLLVLYEFDHHWLTDWLTDSRWVIKSTIQNYIGSSSVCIQLKSQVLVFENLTPVVIRIRNLKKCLKQTPPLFLCMESYVFPLSKSFENIFRFNYKQKQVKNISDNVQTQQGVYFFYYSVSPSDFFQPFLTFSESFVVTTWQNN